MSIFFWLFSSLSSVILVSSVMAFAWSSIKVLCDCMIARTLPSVTASLFSSVLTVLTSSSFFLSSSLVSTAPSTVVAMTG